jgi:hypothetical protein
MKRFELDGTIKLHSAKSLEGTSLCNEYPQKEIGIKKLAYTSLERPILEYGSVCWDLCKRQIME